MSIVLDTEPIVLEETDAAIPCGYLDCTTPSSWSTIWSCSETSTYCDEHLAWARRSSDADFIHCECPGVDHVVHIHIIMVVPL